MKGSGSARFDHRDACAAGERVSRSSEAAGSADGPYDVVRAAQCERHRKRERDGAVAARRFDLCDERVESAAFHLVRYGHPFSARSGIQAFGVRQAEQMSCLSNM
jgi:hypothetical protein